MPDPSAWLVLDEQERIQLAEAHHRAAHIKLPNVKAHACFHPIVENQIAEGLESVVRAMARLMNEGLSRHEALHDKAHGWRMQAWRRQTKQRASGSWLAG